MKRLFTLILLITSTLYGQQEFGFQYRLRSSLNKRGKIIETRIEKQKDSILFGRINGQPLYKLIDKEYATEYCINAERIKCNLEFNDTHDTLKISPWFMQSDTRLIDQGNSKPVGFNLDLDYVFYINNWRSTKFKHYPFISIPFYFRQLTATNIPLRFNLRNGEITGDFLNVNVAHFWLWGRTRIYKSPFVKPKNIYGGIGVFVGGSNIEEDSRKLFGINYGVNFLFSWKSVTLVPAFGIENGINSTVNKYNPYFGLGIGVKLIDLYEPGAK